ncbi:MAG: hypothetical protein H0U44_08330, partial [Flavisolibacter sp.]|nr:hypothetical protein [Flavisolibacter sp.]
AGATFASWDADTKELLVKYNAKKTDKAKIQKAVATVGYDTQDVKATDEAYEKLHGCCKYERASANEATAHSCCGDQKCAKENCHKDGKCTKDMTCCKESGCEKKDCCKKS